VQQHECTGSGKELETRLRGIFEMGSEKRYCATFHGFFIPEDG